MLWTRREKYCRIWKRREKKSKNSKGSWRIYKGYWRKLKNKDNFLKEKLKHKMETC